MPEKHKNLLEALIENASDLILTIDEHGKIKSSNQASREILGLEPQALIGRKFSSILAEPFGNEFEAYIGSYFNQGEMNFLRKGRRILAKPKDNSSSPISVTLNEVPVEGERILSAVIRDIRQILNTEAELEKTTRELARSNSELEQFAAVAAHDLQAPLRTMITMSGSLKRRYKNQIDEAAEDYLDRIERSGLRMQTLITDLLSLSRIGTKEQTLMPTDLNAVFDRILNEIASPLSEAGAQVSRSELPVVLGDQGLLHQVLQNLILNAVKFRKPDVPSKVHLSSCPAPDGYWEFTVEDNGIGIEEKYFSRIFQIFQRLHGKSEYPGSGIGLSICNKIIQRHGGKLWVESEFGQGSNFKFTLRKS